MCVQCADVAVFLCFLFLLYHYFTFAYPLHFNAKQALLHHCALYPSLPFLPFSWEDLVIVLDWRKICGLYLPSPVSF